ncbi:MAG TPA: tetratricopeptide repeat protein [Burkholderiaceae bacterium]
MSARRLPRRASAALLILGACGALHAHEDDAAAAARLPQRVALLARAQSELERGDANAALDDFERAAMMLHAADAEMGLIRAAMQDGQYRRALAFCAHTAGEHVDDADGAALYAWLLRVGGQGELAARTLADAHAHVPDDPLALALDRAFAAWPPVATGVLMQPSHRMAPWPVMLGSQPAPPAAARFASTAVLLDDGAAALVPASALTSHAAARLWVRNGLGQTSAATLDASDAVLSSHGLARLVLQSRMSIGASVTPTGRPPFAGSPGYAMQFGSGDAPAWPGLTQGFLGSLVGDTDVRRLGFDAGSGAAVLDAKGALAGIVSATSDGQARWVPLSALAPAHARPPATPAPARTGFALVAPDEIYEAGLRRVLQVLAADGAP